MKLVPFDPEKGIRLELNQYKIRETAEALIKAVQNAYAEDSTLIPSLDPLISYAQLAIQGKVLKPRSWSEDPLSYEFGDGSMPSSVEDAYGKFTFYTQGSIWRHSKIHQKDGKFFVEIENKFDLVNARLARNSESGSEIELVSAHELKWTKGEMLFVFNTERRISEDNAPDGRYVDLSDYKGPAEVLAEIKEDLEAASESLQTKFYF